MEEKGEKVIDLGLRREQGLTTETSHQCRALKSPIELAFPANVCVRRLMARRKRAILIKRITRMFRPHFPLPGPCQLGRGNIHDNIIHGSFRKAKTFQARSCRITTLDDCH